MQVVLVFFLAVFMWLVGILVSGVLLCIPFGFIETLGWADFTNEMLWVTAVITSSIGTATLHK